MMVATLNCFKILNFSPAFHWHHNNNSLFSNNVIYFESKLWDAAFRHQIILDRSFRSKNYQALVKLVNEISRGRWSNEIESLSRPQNTSELNIACILQVHPLNDDVDFGNMIIFDSLLGKRSFIHCLWCTRKTFTEQTTGSKRKRGKENLVLMEGPRLCLSTTLMTRSRMVSRVLSCPPGGVLPNMGYIGMCGLKG